MNYRDNATPVDIVSGAFGVEKVSMDAAESGQGADQECREAIVWPANGHTILIGNSAAIAALGPKLFTIVDYLVMDVSNTNQLYFSGSEQNVVYILWRS